MITELIFAQYSPGAGESYELYKVPPGSSAKGTLYIAAREGFDIVSVMLIPNGEDPDPKQYIAYRTRLYGNVPIYLQLIYLNEGDVLFITSETGDTSFTYTGEKYT